MISKLPDGETPFGSTSSSPSRSRVISGPPSCSHCLSSVISVAPITAPQTLPAPPITAMNRYSMPWLMPKGLGLTKRCRCAYSQPETQASSAA